MEPSNKPVEGKDQQAIREQLQLSSASVENTEAEGVEILDSINTGKAAVVSEKVKQALEGNAASGTTEIRHDIESEDEVSGSKEHTESGGDEEESSEVAGSAIVMKEVTEIRRDKEKSVKVSEPPIVIKEIPESCEDREESVGVSEPPIVIKEVPESRESKEKRVEFSEHSIVIEDKQKTLETVVATAAAALEITGVEGSGGGPESASGRGVSKNKDGDKADHEESEELDTDDSMEAEKEFQELIETVFSTPDSVIIKRDILEQSCEGMQNDKLQKQFFKIHQDLMKVAQCLISTKQTISITDLSQTTSSDLGSGVQVDMPVKSTPEETGESIKDSTVVEPRPRQESQDVPESSVSVANLTSEPVPEEKHESKNDKLEKQLVTIKSYVMNLAELLRISEPTITIKKIDPSSGVQVDVPVKSTPEGTDASIKDGIVTEPEPKQESQAVPESSVSIANLTSEPVPEEKHESKNDKLEKQLVTIKSYVMNLAELLRISEPTITIKKIYPSRGVQVDVSVKSTPEETDECIKDIEPQPKQESQAVRESSVSIANFTSEPVPEEKHESKNDELEKQLVTIKSYIMNLAELLRISEPTITIKKIDLSSGVQVDVPVKSTPEGTDDNIKDSILIEPQPKQESQAVPESSVSTATFASEPVPEEEQESKLEAK